MNIRLVILLIAFCVLLVTYIFYNIFKRKITLQYSLMWFSYCLIMIVLLLSSPILSSVTSFLGFEVTSNMIFFLGFVALLVVSFNITRFLSSQKEKIVILTQEVGILKEELKKYNGKD